MVHRSSFIILTFLPIAVFWLFWDHLAVNVPKWDDHALKAYLFYSEQETTFIGKLYQLFRQHNEHRIVLDRLVTWLDFNLFSKLNYRHLMLMGNTCLMGVVAIFGLVIRRGLTGEKNTPLLYLPPITFLLFNLSSWENSFWGMAALQNFSVVLWVFWAIYVLSFTQSVWGAIVLAILATLTSGNGLLIWPIGALLLLLQRRVRPLIYWAVSAVVVIGLYFLGYEKPAGNPPVRGSVLDLLKGFLAFNGSAGEVIPFGNALTFCHGLGLLLTVGLGVGAIWSLARLMSPAALLSTINDSFGKQKGTARIAQLFSNHQTTLASPLYIFFLGAIAFLLGTAALVAWSRMGFGLETLITSRYKIYSLLLLCVAYLFLVTQVSARWRSLVTGVGLLGSMGLAFLSYLTYTDEVIWWRRYMLKDQFNWSYRSNQPLSGVDPTTARWIDPAPAYYEGCLSGIYESTHTTSPILIDTVYEASGQWIIKSANPQLATLPRPSLRYPDAGVSLLLQSSKRTYLYGALPSPANNALTVLRRGLFPTADLMASFPTVDPAAGTYQLALLVNDPAAGSCMVYPTERTLTIKPHSNTELQKNW